MTIIAPLNNNNNNLNNSTSFKTTMEGQELWKNKSKDSPTTMNCNQFCPTPKWGLKIYQVMIKSSSSNSTPLHSNTSSSSSLSSLGSRPGSFMTPVCGSRSARNGTSFNNFKQLPFWYGNEDEDQLKLHISQYWEQIKKQDKELSRIPQRPKRFIGKVERTLPKIVYRDGKTTSRQRVKLLLTTDEIFIYESVTRPSWNPFMPQVKKILLRSEWNYETGVLERCKLLGTVDFSSFTPKKQQLQQKEVYEEVLYNVQQESFSSSTPPPSSLIFTPSSRTPLKPHNSNSQNSYIYCMPVHQEEIDCMHINPEKFSFTYFVSAENLKVGFIDPASSAATAANSTKIIEDSSHYIGSKQFSCEEDEELLCEGQQSVEDVQEDFDANEEDQEEEEAEEEDYYDEDDEDYYEESSTFIAYSNCSSFSSFTTHTTFVNNNNPFSQRAFNNATDEEGSGDIFDFEDDSSSGCSPISPPIATSPHTAKLGIAISNKNQFKKFLPY